MNFNKKALFLLVTVPFLLVMMSCKDNPGRHLELGKWYLQKGLLEEAILEFREVPRLLSLDHSELTREEFKLLSDAHYNLALTYSKKGWWDHALKEASICFEMQPTKDHYDLMDLIKRRIEHELSADS